VEDKGMINNLLDIILVEDNPADLELTIDALQEHNLANRVKVLLDGEEAVNYIFRKGQYSDCGICEHPSVILLDLDLPNINGIEILRRVRGDERTKNIPVVILASSWHDQDRIEGYKLGANSYIVKPVEFDSFSKAIADVGYYWAVLNEKP
jgi:two-component system, response regulator